MQLHINYLETTWLTEWLKDRITEGLPTHKAKNN